MDTSSPQKSKAHVVYVPFTGLGLHGGYRGDEWLKNRIKVFKEYTLKSLTNQNNLHFTLWFSFRPEDKHNIIVEDFYHHMLKIDRMTPVFTYGGVCFWDDKYSDKIALERLTESLKTSLPVLRQHVEHADEVLLTIQPSDDMYISSAFQTLQDTDFGSCKVAGWRKGYIMDYSTKEIAEYNPDTIPPFFTIKFPTETFLDPIRHINYTGPYKSHEEVEELGFLELEDRGFVVGTHGENISTTYNHPYKGKILYDAKRDSVLFRTGTYFSEPIKINLKTRLVARKIFNRLPFNNLIRKIYHEYF